MKKFKIKPEAVIFDMDGVIVDSMPYHFIAWYEALRPWGVRVSCFEVYAQEGERWETTLKGLLAREKIKPSHRLLKEIFSLRQKIFKRYFKRHIFCGAYELLEELKKRGFLLGLVTGSPLNEIKRILPARMRRLFASVVAGNQVKNGKPHPEPYLTAARLLGVRPQNCLVVENAPFGISSAKKAGMACVAVSTSLPREYLSEADAVVDRLSRITDHIPL
ncbi:MAG: HAD family phosphatase [Candidatus Omnitrophica bacterium]|jgi:beta-phosphoglucomutase|nr:HAD family phosphatase [Candidatus Omnitrophota bacterium]MDD5042167.1 HAD family phosphatase [Candidatus Omnitrophota bacterium]MDD5500196.1 HAD family phosphatase [Candidatus Omnitrophota bacterium]